MSRRLLRATIAVALLASACSNDAFDKLPRPDDDAVPTTATTAVRELSKVALPPVPGETTSTIDNSPGHATLDGTVAGPDGGVGGATVRVERLVGDGMVRTDVVAGPDGAWTLANIKGGRYRVRAFRPPDLAQPRAEVFLLGGDEERRLDLRVDSFGGVTATRAIAPSPPPVGDPVNLVVRAVRRTVDAEGVVQAEPLIGVTVELFGPGSWSLASPNPAFTDGSGNAAFRLTCREAGSNPLSVVVDGVDVVALDLPACERPAPSTTTTTTEPDDDLIPTSSSSTSTSTTTSSTSSTTTTTTTAPDDGGAGT